MIEFYAKVYLADNSVHQSKIYTLGMNNKPFIYFLHAFNENGYGSRTKIHVSIDDYDGIDKISFWYSMANPTDKESRTWKPLPHFDTLNGNGQTHYENEAKGITNLGGELDRIENLSKFFPENDEYGMSVIKIYSEIQITDKKMM